MHRILHEFHVGSFTIPIYGFGLMLCLAFLGAIGLAAWRAKREKLDPESIYDLAFYVLLGALIGARALYVWEYWGTRIQGFSEIFKIWEGGIIFYGGAIGGAVAIAIYWWRRRFPLLPTLDAIAPSIALGLAIGRVGCFLNGCCYGDVCQLPWSVAFPPGSPPWWQQAMGGQLPGVDAATHQVPPGAPWSHPVHPTQLYSAVDGLILLALLSAYFPLRRRDGEVFALLLTTYPITRFLIEQLRSDEAALFAGLTISQNVSVLILLGGLAFWAFLLLRPPGRYADTAPTSEAMATARA